MYTRPKKYYSYLLICVNNILCIPENPKPLITQINKYFQLKPESVGESDVYLGAKLKLVQLDNGLWAWGMGS